MTYGRDPNICKRRPSTLQRMLVYAQRKGIRPFPDLRLRRYRREVHTTIPTPDPIVSGPSNRRPWL